MSDTPSSLIELQSRFPDDAACARYLVALRWPDGFRCPRCADDHAWMLQTKARTYECAGCGKQTSVTAGTVMHGSKLALTVWFWAAYLMAGHSNGISASQLSKLLGLGSYKTAWLLCAKLRRAMVDPERDPLVGVVEVDETTIAHRSAGGPVPPRPGRSLDGRLPIAAAVEVSGDVPGRIRLARITDYSAVSLRGFLSCNVAAGAIARTDGWSGYAGVPGHEPHVIGPMAAHVVLPWPPTWCCPGFTACSPTSSAGRWGSITASGPSTCSPTSTMVSHQMWGMSWDQHSRYGSSCSVSTAAEIDPPRSNRCSASAPPPNPSPTRC